MAASKRERGKVHIGDIITMFSPEDNGWLSR